MPDLWSERPDLGSVRLSLRSERPDLGSEEVSKKKKCISSTLS